MGTGYIRNDTANNIANGNTVNASDLDGEFDAIQNAFSESSGHTHDGTSAEGGAIEVTGPNQEYLSKATAFYPKNTGVFNLGTSSLRWRDLYLSGTAYVGNITVASLTTSSNLDANGTVDFTGATVTDLGTVTTAIINGGSIDGVTVGATTPSTGDFTSLSVNSNAVWHSGNLNPVTIGTTQTISGNKTFTGAVNIPGGTSSTGGSFANVTVSEDLNVSSGALYTDGSQGYTGINTTTPAYPLDVRGRATFNQTPYVNSAKIWHESNDGSGSGLNADLLDGQHANEFAQLSGATFTGGLTVSNSGPQLVFDESDTNTYSRLTTSGGSLYIQAGASGSGNTSSGGNIRISGINATDVNTLTVRSSGNWQTIWHQGNDGPGSGLNADLLDGNHASAFLGANDTAVNAEKLDNYDSSAFVRVGQDADIRSINFSNLEAGNLVSDGDLIWDLSDGLYYRAGNNNYLIWSEQNDGPGSGLNADLLDGNHASAFLGVNAKASDSDKLDGLNSSQFLRADTSDTMNGNLYLTGNLYTGNGGKVVVNNSSGTYAAFEANGGSLAIYSDDSVKFYESDSPTLRVDWSLNSGTYNFTGNMDVSNTITAGTFSGSHSGNGSGLNNVNADTVDGLHGYQFVRSDVNDTMNGILTLNGNLIVQAGHNTYFGQTSSSRPGLADNVKGAAMTQYGELYCNTNDAVSLGLSRETNGAVTRFAKAGSKVGAIVVDGSSTTYTTSSDYRLKTNVQPLSNSLDKLKALKPSTFEFKSELGEVRQGFIAHEVQEIVPQAVVGEKDGEEMQGLDTSQLVPLLTAALQEALDKIEKLENRIGVLENG